MKKIFAIFAAIAVSASGVFAANRLSSSVASMEGPEGYSFNKALSDRLGMEVYAPADASGAISFGAQEAAGDVTPSAIATVLANALMKDGVHSTMTAAYGAPVHMVASADGLTVLAIAGDKKASRYAVVIFRDKAAAQASALLKSLKMK